jgi:hypothetical protein
MIYLALGAVTNTYIPDKVQDLGNVFLLCQVGPLSGREAKSNDFTAIFAI